MKPLAIPNPATPAEPGYRPSVALPDPFGAAIHLPIPGCESPESCDIDHPAPISWVV